MQEKIPPPKFFKSITTNHIWYSCKTILISQNQEKFSWDFFLSSQYYEQRQLKTRERKKSQTHFKIKVVSRVIFT